MTDSQWGQVVLLLTTIGGFIVTAWRENRNRRWASEDREKATQALIAQAKAEAQALRIKTESIAEAIRIETAVMADKVLMEARLAAAKVREDQRKTADDLRERIDGVHEQARAAFTEANHVNVKIEDLNKRLLEQGVRSDAAAQVAPEATAKLDKIQETADGIDTKVDEIAERTR